MRRRAIKAARHFRTVEVSTHALASDDATYAASEAKIGSLTTERNVIADRVIALVEAAELGYAHVDARQARELVEAANRLIASAH